PDGGMTVKASQKTMNLFAQVLGRTSTVGHSDILLLGVMCRLPGEFLPRCTQDFQRGEMLPSHRCRLNREFRLALGDKAVEALADQDRHHFRYCPDDARLSFVGEVENREQPVYEDRIRIQNQDPSFHKTSRSWRPAKQESCPFSVVGNEELTHPDALWRWRRKRARRDLVRRTEVGFGDLRKHLWPVLLHNVGRSSPDFARRSTAQLHPEFLSLSLKPNDECFTRQNRCRCHRNVRFGAWTLLDLNLLAMVQ